MRPLTNPRLSRPGASTPTTYSASAGPTLRGPRAWGLAGSATPLTGASAVLISYANTKIEELDAQRQTLSKEIADLSAESMSPEQIERLSVYLNRWEEIDFDDRRLVADSLISQIRATGECVAIEWKI